MKRNKLKIYNSNVSLNSMKIYFHSKIYIIFLIFFLVPINVYGGLSKTVEVGIVNIKIKSVTFNSDHAVLTNITAHWGDGGTTYSEPEWTDTGTNNSISQTKNTKIKITVNVDITPTDLPSKSYTLKGDGSTLKFQKTDFISGGNNKSISFTDTDTIPTLQDNIIELSDTINWTMEYDGYSFNLNSSGPHKIYVTFSTPSGGEATEKRVAKAVELTKGFGNNPHNIVKGQMARFPNYVLGVTYFGNIWPLADDIAGGAECQAIVRFVEAVIKMAGVPGTTEGITVYASPSDPDTPIVGSLGPFGGPGMHNFPAQPGTGYRAGLFDGADNYNNYEASLVFTYGGVTKYYPGGVGGAVLDTTTQVLHVFAKMAWAEWDVVLNKFVPKVTIFIYP